EYEYNRLQSLAEYRDTQRFPARVATATVVPAGPVTLPVTATVPAAAARPAVPAQWPDTDGPVQFPVPAGSGCHRFSAPPGTAAPDRAAAVRLYPDRPRSATPQYSGC